MLTIRFARTGRKNKAQFRIVVQEHTATPTGKSVEIVGSWNPHQKEGTFKANRIKYWLSQGAQVSDSVHNLLVSQKIIDDKKRVVKFHKKKTDGEEKEDTDNKKEGNDKVNKDDVKNETKEQSSAEKEEGNKAEEKSNKKIKENVEKDSHKKE